ncbi:hypothetical protein [Paenibacillus hamazuiensis]|nr:hypothetical protein [Paenibacillus hamazuiensis]
MSSGKALLIIDVQVNMFNESNPVYHGWGRLTGKISMSAAFRVL